MARLLPVLVACLLLPDPASAETLLEPGQIGLFGDPGAQQPFVEFRFLQPFDVYVVVREPTYGMRAWETSIEFPLAFTILGIELDHPNSINIGQSDGNLINFIVGLGGGCMGSPDPYPLARITLFNTERVTEAAFICMEPATPSSFDPPVPGYVDCREELAPLDLAWIPGVPAGCGQLGFLCGGEFPLPARTFLGLLSANGAPGEMADMPFLGSSGGYLDCPSQPYDITRLVLELEWDFAVGTLEEAVLDGLPPDWAAAITAQPAGARVEMSGATPIQLLYPPTSEHLASLRFQLTSVPGSTVVDIVSVEAFGSVPGSSLQSLPTYSGGPDIPGPAVLSSKPVSTETRSLGSLKAIFREGN